MGIWADILQYSTDLADRWAAFLTGGAPVALWGIIERIRGKPISLRAYVAVFVVFGFVVASFGTWRAEHQLIRASRSMEDRSTIKARLQECYISGGSILTRQLPKDISSDDFNKYVQQAEKWVDDCADWIGANMGAPARERFLDTTGLAAARSSAAINDKHNRVILNLTRFRQNLLVLIEGGAWDKN